MHYLLVVVWCIILHYQLIVMWFSHWQLIVVWCPIDLINLIWKSKTWNFDATDNLCFSWTLFYDHKMQQYFTLCPCILTLCDFLCEEGGGQWVRIGWRQKQSINVSQAAMATIIHGLKMNFMSETKENIRSHQFFHFPFVCNTLHSVQGS